MPTAYAFFAVIDIVSSVRPWNAPEKTMMFGRFAKALAIFTAFSSASAPLFAKYVRRFGPRTGAIALSFSARRT